MLPMGMLCYLIAPLFLRWPTVGAISDDFYSLGLLVPPSHPEFGPFLYQLSITLGLGVSLGPQMSAI